MDTRTNRQIVLASRPAGMATRENFRFVDSDVPQLKDGEVLIRTLYLSVDPYMRSRMNDRKSYVAPFRLDEPIEGGVVGEVVESKFDLLKVGDIVAGFLPWQLYSLAKAAELMKLDPNVAPITTALGILGMPGLTAYFGLFEIGRPQAGETVVVSGAAGAVGTVVCQLAKIKGCRVVGIAGSEEKNEYLRNELGVDATINYKVGDIRKALQEACPDGVDIYFDNVGGEISDAVIPLINKGARIPLCGVISIYNNLEKPDIGLRPQGYLLVKSALMQGFMVTDFAPRYKEGVAELGKWLAQGKLKYAENIIEGFENTPEAFLGLFKGENLGKQLVKVV